MPSKAAYLMKQAVHKVRNDGIGPALERGGHLVAAPIVSRLGYTLWGEEYPHNIIFVAALHRSGSSWLSEMLSSLPGFVLLRPYHIASRPNWALEPGDFERYRNRLVVLHEHTWGTQSNVEILEEENIRYVIQIRDLRDVAVSVVKFAKHRSTHPLHSLVVERPLEEALMAYCEHQLEKDIEWMELWLENRNPDMSLVSTYEKLSEQTEESLKSILSFYGVDVSRDVVNRIVEDHKFQSVTGRSRGNEQARSMKRKGVPGDWQNHFTPEIREIFEERAGDLLRSLGYE